MNYCTSRATPETGEYLLHIYAAKLSGLTTIRDRKSKPWIHSFGKKLSVFRIAPNSASAADGEARTSIITVL